VRLHWAAGYPARNKPDPLAGSPRGSIQGQLLSGPDRWSRIVKPILDRIGELLADRMGRAERGLEVDLVRRAILGAQWAIGLDFLGDRRK